MVENTQTPASDRLRDKLHDLKDDLAALADLAVGAAKEKGAALKSRIAGCRHDVAGEVGEASDGALDYVRRNPTAALLIAAGVGAVIGAVFSRRS